MYPDQQQPNQSGQPQPPNQPTGPMVYGPPPSMPQPTANGQTPPPPQSPPPRRSSRLPLIIAAAAAAILLIVIIVVVVVSSGKDSPGQTAEQAAQNTAAEGPQPATAIGTEQANNSISQDVSRLSDDTDFPADMLDDKALGL